MTTITENSKKPACPISPSLERRRYEMGGELRALLRLQSWLSPAFPIGAYSYSHGLEWAVETGNVRGRASLVEWLEADLRFGTGRNDGIFFCEAWRRAKFEEAAPLVELAELAAAYRGSSEFALEAAQQGEAFLATIRRV
ncbi:MAG TPA: urease accessory UreF family protein, partial [Hyphomicrobiales bacterium]|nr:urease accessory UreF family protein [Hyphomicrobiales bacterium]